MKLPDFTTHRGLNELRSKMGAEMITYIIFDPEWERISVQLENEGIDVAVDDVEIEVDGSFTYRGRRVIVYIRDQKESVWVKGSYKYHLAQCTTLEDMLSRGRYKRYVVTNRSDGMFVTNLLDSRSNVLSAKLVRRLDVCKNCLTKLMLPVAPSNFDLNAFFRRQKSQITKMPEHTDRTAPLVTQTKLEHQRAARVPSFRR